MAVEYRDGIYVSSLNYGDDPLAGYQELWHGDESKVNGLLHARFIPFHWGHYQCVEKCLSMCDVLYIMMPRIGRIPFDLRIEMLAAAAKTMDGAEGRIYVVPVVWKRSIPVDRTPRYRDQQAFRTYPSIDLYAALRDICPALHINKMFSGSAINIYNGTADNDYVLGLVRRRYAEEHGIEYIVMPRSELTGHGTMDAIKAKDRRAVAEGVPACVMDVLDKYIDWNSPDDVFPWRWSPNTGALNYTIAQYVSMFETQIQQRLDNFAKTLTYDSIMSACTYVTSSVEMYRIEGQYCVDMRDATWAKAYEILSDWDVEANGIPTWSYIEGLLPELSWPEGSRGYTGA